MAAALKSSQVTALRVAWSLVILAAVSLAVLALFIWPDKPTPAASSPWITGNSEPAPPPPSTDPEERANELRREETRKFMNREQDLTREIEALHAKIQHLEAEADLRKTQERAMYEASRAAGYKKPLKIPDDWGR